MPHQVVAPHEGVWQGQVQTVQLLLEEREHNLVDLVVLALTEGGVADIVIGTLGVPHHDNLEVGLLQTEESSDFSSSTEVHSNLNCLTEVIFVAYLLAA
jgi:hypothetical protein